jgi:hypothetical protein
VSASRWRRSRPLGTPSLLSPHAKPPVRHQDSARAAFHGGSSSSEALTDDQEVEVCVNQRAGGVPGLDRDLIPRSSFHVSEDG